ncbi:hypothetical protein [Moheibacter sp.]|uniref:hypothetical protein n=1 Tax=Moheibacter sp. TaxID=1965316 RepID=UPI003C7763CF
MNSFFQFNKTTRKWHFPVVAGIAVGIPLFIGWYLGDIESGKLASLAGLSILYIQSDDLIERMILLMTCCFGIMVSYTIGLLFSFSPYVAPCSMFRAAKFHWPIFTMQSKIQMFSERKTIVPVRIAPSGRI